MEKGEVPSEQKEKNFEPRMNANLREVKRLEKLLVIRYGLLTRLSRVGLVRRRFFDFLTFGLFVSSERLLSQG
jgi:hypothetical protein